MLSCDGYRGIAVGTLCAKVYASVLERRLSLWSEQHHLRAEGQFGFRSGRNCAQANFVLRALVDQSRYNHQKLFACFVDFKKAYDSVPRHLLWAKLQQRGVSGWVLEAVKALYGDVPMLVKSAAGFSGCFQSTIGVKQGCPLSPLLFGLYVDDLERELAARHTAGYGLDLPTLQMKPVHCLLYADDVLLTSTSAAGLRQQALLLEEYSSKWGLTVNAGKTKVVVFGMQRDVATEETVQLSIGGVPVEVVDTFTYLGVTVKAGCGFKASAFAGRQRAGKRAMFGVRRRLRALGIQSPDTHFRVFDSLVDPVVSYGVEIWGPEVLCCEDPNKLEKVQLAYIKSVLGVRTSTSNSVVLAECGRWPMAMRWLYQVIRFYNLLTDEPLDSLLGCALASNKDLMGRSHDVPSLFSKRCWVSQWAVALQAWGVIPDLNIPRVLDLDASCAAWQRRYMDMINSDSKPMAQLYFQTVRGSVDFCNYCASSYLEKVRRWSLRRRLTQLRTGSHWLRELTGRWGQRERDVSEQCCLFCRRSGLEVAEDVKHMIFDCQAYSDIRAEFVALFHPDVVCVSSFLQQEPQTLACFALACYRQHLRVCRHV